MKRLFAFVFLILLGCVTAYAATPPPAVSIADVTCSETIGNCVLTLTKSASSKVSKVSVSTTDGTAKAGYDYNAVNLAVTMGPSQTVAYVNVPIINDALTEGNETFTVTIKAVRNATIARSPATVTILDDETTNPPATPPDFTVSDVSVNEGAGTVTVHVLKTGSDGLASQINYATSDGSAVTGQDYSARSGSLSFQDGDTDKTFTVPILQDTIVEGNENFFVTIRPSSNGTVSNSQGMVTILDDDTTPNPVPPNFSVTDTTVNESAGTVTVHITKTAANGSSSSLTYATADGTAKAGSDYTSTSGSISFLNGDTDKTVTVPITNDTTPEGDETFAFNITSVTNATIVKGGTVTILANDAVSGYVLSPTLAGAPDVASSFDFSLSLQKSWGTGAIAGSGAPDVVGAFRFICGAGQVAKDDPIVFPGSPGSSHTHQFYGNNSADGNSTFNSLRQGGTSTCNNGTYAANRSGYWMPAMLDGAGHVVQPDYVSIYYKRRPASDPKCSLASGDPKAQGNCVAIPNGLRFIFGYDMLTGTIPTGGIHWNCQGPTATPGTYATFALAKAACPTTPTNGVYNQIGAIISAPDCWDGVNLDSPNHRSHVANATYGSWGYLKCPADHPYVIPTFQLGAWYTVDSNLGTWTLASDAMAGTAAGGSFHADYFEAWDPTVKKLWTDNCINKLLNCSGGDLGNGLQLIGASKPSYGWLNPNRLIAAP